ncbi:FtsX-like permease family protein [Protofrankia symbiont of Coriaria ruscifolia]|uniref:FtsX-like permease family protein n=1 Tax=Protofrankia symbiont of Coriaria ruscifolia TaxID=1306542 RepID=UPI001A951194|nr:FtsX-like permease family protein [Protofrankia symbiont of Coriaria ruscifolia]
MRALSWIRGLVMRSPAAVLGGAVSVAVTVAFVASLVSFISISSADLTVRAAARVPVDWQVQVTPQGDPARVDAAVARLPDLRAQVAVDRVAVPALSATGPDGSRQTGQAQILAMPQNYAGVFSREIKPLVGSARGVLLAQQTAANLAVVPGGSITVRTADGAISALTVDGVVDLPAADSLFQVVGAPANAGATAPPDNVVLVPPDRFPALARGGTVVHQIHVGFDHTALPHDPAAATTLIRQRDNHLQIEVAGGALVGDNLQSALSGAREDALYALLLVLLLGLPGVVLAAVVAVLVVALRGERRRREVALLRLRGAGPGAVLRLIAGETALTAFLGAALGLPMAWLAIRLVLPAGSHLVPASTWTALGIGVAVAAGTQLGPAIRVMLDRRAGTVQADTSLAPRDRAPWPLRFGLDWILLAGAAVTFWLTSRGGYHVVLAPEGVATTSVNYAALLGPAMAWPGLALLVWRVSAGWFGRRTGRLSRDRPGHAPELEAASLRRRRHIVARGAAGLAVALGLAASTAVFTSTYDAQARLDVALTVGADVAVTEPPGAVVSPSASDTLSNAPGVSAVEPLQHRFAYVGPDLQDLYGVNADTIRRVAPLHDSFTPGSTVSSALGALGRTPDGVLLSAETLHDYQLRPGDPVRLRLQTGPNRLYQPVTFHVIGQIKEFPTAPKDSFIVANAVYITRVTDSDAVGSFLIGSSDPTVTAASLRSRVAPGVQVTDVRSARATVTTASGLAASDLAGLSKLELGFGVLLALACSGLALLLGASQRRRSLVLLHALGATSQQRGRFLAVEARGLLLGGVVGGAAIAAAISYLLIKVLTGIFDPPPAAPAIPVVYLVALVAGVVAAAALVVVLGGRVMGAAGPKELRDL